MIYLGIDLHKRYSFAVAINEEGKIVNQKRLPHCRETWNQYISSFKEPVQAVIEATLNWYFLADWLEPVVSKLLLANPVKVRAIAEAKIKTDRIDAHMLAQLLRVNLIPECYISKPETRDDKNLLRHRISLVRLRTQLKNKVHALLARNAVNDDIEYSDLFGKSGTSYLKALQLPINDSWILNQLLWNIQNINQAIKDADRKIHASMQSDSSAKLLSSIPGIGQFLSLLVTSEIGDINRFAHPKNLCSYAGLVPSTYSSGDKIRMGRLIHQGNKWLRWGLVEAANIAPRHSPTFRKIYSRVKARKGPNTAKVALARYILTVIFNILKNNQAFIEGFSLGHPHGELACNS